MGCEFTLALGTSRDSQDERGSFHHSANAPLRTSWLAREAGRRKLKRGCCKPVTPEKNLIDQRELSLAVAYAPNAGTAAGVDRDWSWCALAAGTGGGS